MADDFLFIRFRIVGILRRYSFMFLNISNESLFISKSSKVEKIFFKLLFCTSFRKRDHDSDQELAESIEVMTSLL